jgi:hypothetical protein
MRILRCAPTQSEMHVQKYGGGAKRSSIIPSPINSVPRCTDQRNLLAESLKMSNASSALLAEVQQLHLFTTSVLHVRGQRLRQRESIGVSAKLRAQKTRTEHNKHETRRTHVE